MPRPMRAPTFSVLRTDLGLEAERAEVLGVAGDAALDRAVRLESPVEVRAERLLGADAERAEVARRAAAVGEQRVGAQADDAADQLDPVEAEPGPSARAHRRADARRPARSGSR